jgi:O-antigen/teichoic acid export membrane protein
MTSPFQQSWLMTRVGGFCARFGFAIPPVKIRAALLDYSYLLGSSFARLGLGGLFFAILVNCLSLADYGVFASAVATALMIGNGGTFGFNAPLFRAAATRPRIVGAYVVALLVYALATIPFVLALTFLAHLLILGSFISLPSLIAIVLSEALCARLVLTIQSLHVGLGRYALASAIGILPQLLRSAAVAAFWFFAWKGLDHWASLYLAANLLALLIALLSLPRNRLRWRTKIFVGRLSESLAFASAYLVLALQTELDKLLVLVMTTPDTAGLYALTMRIIELVTVPLRAFSPVYIKRLMRRPELLTDRRLGIGVELAIAVAATGLFALLLVALRLEPRILGANVAAANTWFAGLLILPAAKILTDFHRDIYFAANRLYSSAVIALLLLALRLGGLALIITLLPDHNRWLVPLNLLFGALYAVSAAFTWRSIYGAGGNRIRRLPPDAVA